MSIILTNAKLIIGTSSSQDFSTMCTRLRLTREFDEHDDTRMGMTAHSRVAGLETWNVEAEILQEFGSTQAVAVDSLLSSLVGKVVGIAVRPFNAARTSDNPEYSGNVLVRTYTPMDGSVGDLLKTVVQFPSAGNLSRFVSSTS